MTLEELEAEARKLPPEQRARLADSIDESLQETPPAEVKAAWDREITARIQAYERGETRTYPADDVFAEARRLAQ
ncbi:MAG: addiction module protein [Chloroflexota bacterium]